MRTPIGYDHEYRDAEGEEWRSLGKIEPEDWAGFKIKVDAANQEAGFYHQRLKPIYEKPAAKPRRYEF